MSKSGFSIIAWKDAAPVFRRRVVRCVMAGALVIVVFVLLSAALTLLRPTLASLPPSTRDFIVIAVTAASGFTGLALIVFGVFTGSRLAALGKAVRAHHGSVCTECAYILTDLGDAGACPECGAGFDRQQLQQRWTSAGMLRGR